MFDLIKNRAVPDRQPPMWRTCGGPVADRRCAVSFKLRSLVFAVFMLVFGSALQAHELRPVVMDIGISDDRPGQMAIRLTLSGEAVLAGLDLSGITDTDASDRSAAYDALRALSSADLASRMRAGFADLAADITLRIGGEEAALALMDVSVIEEADLRLARDTVLEIGVHQPAGGGEISVDWPGARGALLIRQMGVGSDPAYADYLPDGGTSNSFTLATGVPPPVGEVITTYVHSGIIHIIPAGLDHILFVIGLLAYSLSGRALIWQVSLFTVAHTLTLGLASLGWVNVSGDIVEPLIALSIAWIGIENMRRTRSGLRPSRALVVFGFGLLHGLGFASVLSEFGLPTSAFIVGLVSFNIGVEIGQLLIVLPVFVALKAMKLSAPTFRRGFQLPVSAAISAIGLFWVAERTGLVGML